MSVSSEFLRSTPYFANLAGAGELSQVGKYVFEKNTEKGELILAEGDAPAAMYFVVSGAVKMFKTSPDGKEQILSIVRSGDSFNDVPTFDGSPNTASAQAMVPSLLYSIGRSDLETIIRQHPQVAMNVSRVMAKQVRQLGTLVEDLSFKNVTSRVAKILLEHASDGSGERLRLTQQDMAAMAGTAREVVGRALKALEGEGVIKIDRHRIVVKDKDALKQVAGAYI
jgi:CRP-like cAMP-binding protein